MSFACAQRFFGSVPKQPGDGDRNEDAFRWRPERRALALSDGATESFDSKLWARILARRFVRDLDLSFGWVAAAIEVFRRHHKPDAMTWSRRAAFNRGSYATLLGVETNPEATEARIVAIGDSIAALLDGRELVTTFPYTDPDEFRRRPSLLSTKPEQNKFLDKAKTPPSTVWRLTDYGEPRIVCMTDAVGEWFLRLAGADRTCGDILLAIKETSQLEAVVAHEREAGRMRVDDATVLILE